jgi:sarcosine oxidase subunit beta
MPEAADVVVVGGGVIGCACAYELARRGVRVVLVERSELAAGASGRNHGLLLAPLDHALVDMAAASRDVYRTTVPEFSLDVHLDPEPIGYLIAAGDSDHERTAARAEADAAVAAGVRVERLDGPDLHDAEPELSPDVAEAWLLDDGFRLDPGALTVALGLLAGRHGAAVQRHLTVRGFLRDGERIRGVVTDDGPIAAGAVVLAAGPWSGTLLRAIGIHLPVIGLRGWLVQLAARPGLLSHLIGRSGWHTLLGQEALARVRASELADAAPQPPPSSLLQPNLDGTLLAGGSRQAALANEPEDSTVPRTIVREAIRLVPAVADAEVLAAWWGVRPMTPDGRPIVGTLADGLVVATGHGSQGVILGAGTGSLVASMLTGEAPPFDPAPFQPARFAWDQPVPLTP